MIFTVLIPPAIALILVGAWVGPQRRSMAVLEAECARLQSAITAAEAPSTTRPDPLEKRRKRLMRVLPIFFAPLMLPRRLHAFRG